MCKIQPIYCEKSVTDADTPVVSFVFFSPPYSAFQATPSTDSSHVLWRTLLKYIHEVIEHFLTSQERTEVKNNICTEDSAISFCLHALFQHFTV